MNNQDSEFVMFEEQFLQTLLEAYNEYIVYMANLDEYLNKLTPIRKIGNKVFAKNTIGEIINGAIDYPDMHMVELNYKIFVREYIRQILYCYIKIIEKCDWIKRGDLVLLEDMGIWIEEIKGELSIETDSKIFTQALKVNPNTDKLFAYPMYTENLIKSIIEEQREEFKKWDNKLE